MPDIDVSYPVNGVGQAEREPAWAASLRMLLNYLLHEDLPPADVIGRAGYTFEDYLGWDACMDVARSWDLGTSVTAGRDVEEWGEKLRSYGPLWVCPTTSERAVVVTGMRGDGTPARTSFQVIDVWSGPAIETYDTLEKLLDKIEGAPDGSNLYLIHK